MQSIRRLYVAKKGIFADEAKRLLTDLQENLLIKGLTDIHIFHRYDVSGLDDAAFEAAKNMIFSEPPVDAVYDTLPTREGDTVLAVEYLPGQYDQRADSAVQCLQMLTMKMTAWSGRLRSSSCPVTCRVQILRPSRITASTRWKPAKLLWNRPRRWNWLGKNRPTSRR